MELGVGAFVLILFVLGVLGVLNVAAKHGYFLEALILMTLFLIVMFLSAIGAVFVGGGIR